MPAQHVTAWNLFKSQANTSCCDCSKEVASVVDRDPEQTWVIWNGRFVYCPKCAKREGILD